MQCFVDDEGITIQSMVFVKLFIPFDNIVQIKKVWMWEAIIRSFDPSRPPIIGFPQGTSLHVILIEKKNRQWVGISPPNMDKFLKVAQNKLNLSRQKHS